jgi:heme oxygenase
MDDILVRLRRDTRAEHDAIERQLGLADASLSLDHYRRRLQQFWGFYSPLEARLIAGKDDDVAWPDRRKSAWLAADLRALGVTPEALPRCSDLPDLPGPAAVLGCAYVLEGATLGGQILSRHVAGCLGLSTETGGRFFHGYGERTGAMWKAFTSTVRGFVARHGQEDAIVDGAVDTFRSLRAWCG